MTPRLLAPLCMLVLAACASPATPPRAADIPAGVRYVLLGEVHDNPAGHARRFEWLRTRVAAGWRPAIAMEQFDRERQPALDRALRECPDAACVIQAAAPEAGAWQWPYYAPVIELALAHRLPLLAANLSRADAARIVREGPAAALDAATRTRYGLDAPLPPALEAGQRQEIAQGHCNMLPASVLPGMVRAQVARDAWMAKTLADATAPAVVLLAGNGHVRRDLGVAHWLPAGESLAIGYLEDASATAAAFDRIERIPAHPRGDPCAAFRGRPSPATPPAAPAGPT
ncbi:MAG: ChaN family lipoprotein [Candidatus Dactylopiibacterium sp.]|nr:ChaN family lipoprotein [Candidatus Dactylopiibacterium sp.]